jgi:hypothetical protein
MSQKLDLLKEALDGIARDEGSFRKFLESIPELERKTHVAQVNNVVSYTQDLHPPGGPGRPSEANANYQLHSVPEWDEAQQHYRNCVSRLLGAQPNLLRGYPELSVLRN